MTIAISSTASATADERASLAGGGWPSTGERCLVVIEKHTQRPRLAVDKRFDVGIDEIRTAFPGIGIEADEERNQEIRDAGRPHAAGELLVVEMHDRDRLAGDVAREPGDLIRRKTLRAGQRVDLALCAVRGEDGRERVGAILSRDM